MKGKAEGSLMLPPYPSGLCGICARWSAVCLIRIVQTRPPLASLLGEDSQSCQGL